MLSQDKQGWGGDLAELPVVQLARPGQVLLERHHRGEQQTYLVVGQLVAGAVHPSVQATNCRMLVAGNKATHGTAHHPQQEPCGNVLQRAGRLNEGERSEPFRLCRLGCMQGPRCVTSPPADAAPGAV